MRAFAFVRPGAGKRPSRNPASREARSRWPAPHPTPPRLPCLWAYAIRGPVRRLKDFAAIRDFFGDREIDELQAAVDARRQARAPGVRPTGGAGCNVPGPPARPTPGEHPTEEGKGK